MPMPRPARVNGATVLRHTKVEELVQTPDGTWDVITNKGTIHAEHVVNAGGPWWARECGRMVGIELPVLAMEHMYLPDRRDGGSGPHTTKPPARN